MQFSLAIRDDGEYLLVTATGDAQLAHLCALADFCATIARMKGHSLLLVDLLAVAPDLTFTEHLQLGAHFAQALSALQRVATVVAERERKGTSEKAAQKNGLLLRAFTQLEDGRRWLTQAPG